MSKIEPYHEAMDEWRYDYLSKLLDKAKGNSEKAAELAEISKRHVNRLLKQSGMSSEEFRTPYDKSH